jgi:hypothetical protein
MPNLNIEDNTAVPGYINSFMIARVLKACGDNLTRDNVLKQATNLRSPPVGMLREGVSISTSPDNYLPFSSARFIRFDGARWVTFGEPVAMKDEASR